MVVSAKKSAVPTVSKIVQIHKNTVCTADVAESLQERLDLPACGSWSLELVASSQLANDNPVTTTETIYLTLSRRMVKYFQVPL